MVLQNSFKTSSKKDWVVHIGCLFKTLPNLGVGQTGGGSHKNRMNAPVQEICPFRGFS